MFKNKDKQWREIELHIHLSRDSTESLSGARIVKPRLEGAGIAAGKWEVVLHVWETPGSYLKSLWLLSREWSEEGTGAGWLCVPWDWEHSYRDLLRKVEAQKSKGFGAMWQRTWDNLQRRRPLCSRKNSKAWPVFIGARVSSIRNVKVSEADIRIQRLEMVRLWAVILSPRGVWTSE